MKRQLHNLILLFLLTSSIYSYAQRGIGTTNPHQSAILELKSTNKGFLLPRMSATQIANIVDPQAGLMVYCESGCATIGIYLFNGTEFKLVDLEASTINSNYSILSQIGNEADSPNTTTSTITGAQLNLLLPALANLDTSREVEYQNYIDANPNLFSSPATLSEVQNMINEINKYFIGNDGRIWASKNVGATRVATSETDYLAYGNLFQWGRKADGHEVVNWTSSTTGSITAVGLQLASHSTASSLFIVANPWALGIPPLVWFGVDAEHNPCTMPGYRLPTNGEWNVWKNAPGNETAAGRFADLKLPYAGERRWDIGAGNLNNVGTQGRYWSATGSTVSSAVGFLIDSGQAISTGENKSRGWSVRCIKDN